MSVTAVTFCEGEVREVKRFASIEIYNAYKEGFCDGAGAYGCGEVDVIAEHELIDASPKYVALYKEAISAT